MTLTRGRKEVVAMPGFLRRRGFGPVVLFAALVAGAMVTAGCGSQPAADQEASGVGGETAEVTQGEATEEGPAGELAEPEGSPSELPSAQAQPAAEEAAPSTPAAEPAAPVAAAVAESAPPVAAAAAVAAVDWVSTSQKWVPIFSMESEGVYVGAAHVAGPTSQVGKVKGVAEVRLSFKDIGRIYAYVPVSTISITKLNRVQGVSVWAIGDLQIAEL
jgi:hypothetical protein